MPRKKRYEIRQIENVWVSKGEPLLYVYFQRNGWFILSQMCRKVFQMSLSQMEFKIWCAKHIVSSTGYKTKNALYATNIHKVEDINVINSMIALGFAPNKDYNDRRRYPLAFDNTPIQIIDLASVKNLMLLQNPLTMVMLQVIEKIAGKSAKRARAAVTQSDRYKILISQECKCADCQKYIGNDYPFEIDHLHQVSQGGGSAYSNLQALCLECHRYKTINERQIRLI